MRRFSIIAAILSFGFCSGMLARDPKELRPAHPATSTTSAKNTVTFTRSDAKGIGAEKGVMRRDPSNIIKVGRIKENPEIPGNHEVLVWPQGNGVAAMIGTTGPKEITNTIHYAEDGIHFSKSHEVKDGPWAGGAYRPEALTRSGTGEFPEGGVEIGKSKGQLPFVGRFDLSEKSNVEALPTNP